MKDKSTVKKMRHAFLGSAILLIIAVIAYGIGCYPLYINAKSNKKGRIEIEYYSEEDLERIVSLLETIK